MMRKLDEYRQSHLDQVRCCGYTYRQLIFIPVIWSLRYTSQNLLLLFFCEYWVHVCSVIL